MIDFAVLSVMATLVLTVRLVRDLRPTAVAAGVERWSQRFGLTVTDDVRPFLLRRRRTTWLGYALGLWLGMEAGAVAQLLLSDQRWSLAGTLATQAGWWVAGGTGAVLGGCLGARVSPTTGPLVARARAVTISDYVDPVERALAPVAAVAALAGGLAPLAVGAAGGAAATAAAAGIGGVLVVGIAEAVARGTVRRSQRASSTHLLAWSDALRSETVRTALSAGALLAVATLVVSIPALLTASGSPGEPGAASLWALLGLVVVLAASGVRSMLTDPARHFLRRLWPATAAELTEHERPSMAAAR